MGEIVLPPDCGGPGGSDEQIRFTELMERLAGSPDLLGTGVLDDSELDELFELLCTRRLDRIPFPFVHLEVARLDSGAGTVGSPGWFLTATGLTESDDPEPLGIAARDRSSDPSWLSFLLSLERRGLGGVRVVTGPAGERLGYLVPSVFPGAHWEPVPPGWRPEWMWATQQAAEAPRPGPDEINGARR